MTLGQSDSWNGQEVNIKSLDGKQVANPFNWTKDTPGMAGEDGILYRRENFDTPIDRQLIEEERKQIEAATRIQTQHRGYLARTTVNKAKQEAEEQAAKEDEEQAAKKDEEQAAKEEVSGILKMKVKGSLFGDSWPEVECHFTKEDGGTFTYRTLDGSERGERTNCILVDMVNREGKKQHRFDVTGDGGSEAVQLAAASDEEKRMWTTAIDKVEVEREALKKMNLPSLNSLEGWDDEMYGAEVGHIYIYTGEVPVEINGGDSISKGELFEILDLFSNEGFISIKPKKLKLINGELLEKKMDLPDLNSLQVENDDLLRGIHKEGNKYKYTGPDYIAIEGKGDSISNGDPFEIISFQFGTNKGTVIPKKLKVVNDDEDVEYC